MSASVWLLILAGLGGLLLVWAACWISGRLADEEGRQTSEEERTR